MLWYNLAKILYVVRLLMSAMNFRKHPVSEHCLNVQSVASKVLQPQLTLEHESHTKSDLPGLAQAIGYSLKTEGAFLHKLLQVVYLSS